MSQPTSPHSSPAIPKLTDPVRHRFLMCSPEQFGIFYVINAWMEGNIERSQREQAHHQWEALRRLVETTGEVVTLEPQRGLSDLVYVSCGAFIFGENAVLSRFSPEERRDEEPVYEKWFKDAGYKLHVPPPNVHFEGAADAILDRTRRRVFLGYGQRTDLQAAAFLSETLHVEVIPLRLIEERFFHLHSAFCALAGGFFIYYPGAFDDRSLHLLERSISPRRRFAIGERDALNFACNLIDCGNEIILHDCSPTLEDTLREWGFTVHKTPLDQFHLGGGSARSLTLRLDEPEIPGGATTVEGLPTRTLHFRGHLIRRGVLRAAAEAIQRAGGDFTIDHFVPGTLEVDVSELTITVSATDDAQLDEIVSTLLPLGGESRMPEATPAVIVAVDKDGVAPDTFYSTTIFPTFALVAGAWLRAEGQRMDATLRIDRTELAPRVICTLIRDLKRGDEVIVGTDGIRIEVGRKEEEAGEDFKFMSSEISSERRVEVAVDKVAREMVAIRRRGGRIVFVSGPVVVHTGGAPYLAKLIREGYVQALLGGNAIAVHDMESQLYGTSLGVDLKRGVPVGGGHQHHIRTINTIRRAGSIKAAVDQGIITTGVMYELTKAGVPYCLAGSIRDDGPLPETEMDLVKAQTEYQRLLVGADMIVMLSSMLHSIGTGNMTPAGVKMVSVDINPAVATKLADRGSLDSIPIVTDVGLFLNLLSRRVEELG